MNPPANTTWTTRTTAKIHHMMQCLEKSFVNHGARRIAAIGPFAGTHLQDDMMSNETISTTRPDKKSIRTASMLLKNSIVHLRLYLPQGTISP